MSRRGVALLVVLGALLVVTTAVSTSMLSATNAQRGDHVHRAELRAADLLHASEVITDRWLRTESSRAVVDPALPEPRLTIADIRHADCSFDTTVRLTAWDLLGILPANMPQNHPFTRLGGRREDIASAHSLAELSNPESPVHPEQDRFSGRLGGRMAVFPRQDRVSLSGSIVVNVNTAPPELLHAATGIVQGVDVDSVLRARAQGVPSPAPRTSGATSNVVQLIGRSNLWAIRADITVGPITRSWWTVYESRGRGWSIIDRHEIAG